MLGTIVTQVAGQISCILYALGTLLSAVL